MNKKEKEGEVFSFILASTTIICGFYVICDLLINKEKDRKDEKKSKEIEIFKEIREGSNPPKRIHWKFKEHYL